MWLAVACLSLLTLASSALVGRSQIPEEVVRTVIGSYGGPKPVYLLINGEPAPQSLVERLSDLRIKIRSARDTTLEDGTAVDAVTKEPVIVCELQTIHWTGPFTANVKASTYEGPMGGSGAVYHLFGTPLGWSVVSVSDGWAS